MERWGATGAGLALVFAGALAAWGGAAPATIQAEGLSISLVTVPSQPARHEATTFEVSIRDAGGMPVARARVSLDVKMAGMAMEENRPRVQERAGGRYVATGAFSMGGEWLAAVEVVLTDGRRARAEFPLRVR